MEKVKATLKRLWELSGSLPYLRLVILATVLVLAVILFYSCGNSPSKNEIDLKNKTDEAIQQTAETSVAVQEVKQAEKDVETGKKEVRATKEVANKAVKAVEEHRARKPEDVTYEQANKARCTAYPEDSECKRGN